MYWIIGITFALAISAIFTIVILVKEEHLFDFLEKRKIFYSTAVDYYNWDKVIVKKDYRIQGLLITAVVLFFISLLIWPLLLIFIVGIVIYIFLVQEEELKKCIQIIVKIFTTKSE